MSEVGAEEEEEEEEGEVVQRAAGCRARLEGGEGRRRKLFSRSTRFFLASTPEVASADEVRFAEPARIMAPASFAS